MWQRVRHIFPWLIAVLILYYLFEKYPLNRILETLRYGRIPALISYTLAYFLFMWYWDICSLRWLLTRLGYPKSYREIGVIRFASYFIMVFNFGAAQAGLAYFLKKKGVPFFKGTSLVLFTAIIDLYWTIALAFLGSFALELVVDGFNISRIIQVVWGGASVGLACLIVFWRLPINWRALHWARSRDFFHAFHRTKPRDYLVMMLLRLPLHLALNSTLYFAAWIFQAHLPLLKVLAYSPIVVLVGAVPITPGGLGTTQVATVELFKNHLVGPVIEQGLVSAPELLISMGLCCIFLNLTFKAIAGAFFLHRGLMEKAPL